MKILYVANHSKGQNDNEGAITHALRTLGHKITRFHEKDPNTLQRVINLQHDYDFLLFQKWNAQHDLKRIEIPKVFWYFDLVNFPDSALASRNLTRMQWMHNTVPYIDLGFCTDGDWVNHDKTSKLIKLTQGADERVTKIVPSTNDETKIVFTGTVRGGKGRLSFIAAMRERYNDKFVVYNNIFRDKLANLFSKNTIVIAPDAPVTSYYYSNRVYNTLNFGGFLLHPYSEALHKEYEDGDDLIVYYNRDHLFELIDSFLTHSEARDRIRHHGRITTLAKHTYHHRCEVLISTIQERLNL